MKLHPSHERVYAIRRALEQAGMAARDASLDPNLPRSARRRLAKTYSDCFRARDDMLGALKEASELSK